MTKTKEVSETSTAVDPELHIEVDHSAYYRWVPIAVADVYDDRGGDLDNIAEGQVRWTQTQESTFPGFRLQQITVNEPTTSQTTVHLPSLSKINDDRAAAGLSRRTHSSNLIRLLEDAGWARQFPVDTITAIRCDDPKWDGWLNSHFLAVADEVDTYEAANITTGEAE